VTTTDPVGTALAAIGAGATTGAVALTGGVLALRILQGQPAGIADDTAATLLTVSLAAGLVAAVATGWARTAAIDDYWRRGVTAAIAVLAMALLAVAATAVDQFAGPVGLGGYLLLLVAASIVTHRTARRNAGR
jgi:hypothetical protein